MHLAQMRPDRPARLLPVPIPRSPRAAPSRYSRRFLQGVLGSCDEPPRGDPCKAHPNRFKRALSGGPSSCPRVPFGTGPENGPSGSRVLGREAPPAVCARSLPVVGGGGVRRATVDRRATKSVASRATSTATQRFRSFGVVAEGSRQLEC